MEEARPIGINKSIEVKDATSIYLAHVSETLKISQDSFDCNKMTYLKN